MDTFQACSPVGHALGANGELPEGLGLLPVRPRTMVEQAAQAILAAAARGTFLPGDRLVEAEIARDLGISRVPVREALRQLESQGILVNAPYKGMRLTPVTNRTARNLIRVRQSIETLAIAETVAHGAEEALDGMRASLPSLRAAVADGDRGRLGEAEREFHHQLCAAADNPILLRVWRGLGHQMLLLWGLIHAEIDPATLAENAAAVLARMEAGDAPGASRLLVRHLETQIDHDFEAALARRRQERRR
ncbi:GntR family transcriptional regulator [Roseomonas sp. NAR14]|uniref:GntR family transcriptional regulator n=1 Tax=Roseomonas acroporae TaxID=2937791 RepID=A0A9X1Y6Z2_9PROT|nr:GntR family transcriptional regulator [Roseomonas acroporae]MCK8784728.1 GntR family transcriptional regulator [Roseomonas acroporae]